MQGAYLTDQAIIGDPSHMAKPRGPDANRRGFCSLMFPRQGTDLVRKDKNQVVVPTIGHWDEKALDRPGFPGGHQAGESHPLRRVGHEQGPADR